MTPPIKWGMMMRQQLTLILTVTSLSIVTSDFLCPEKSGIFPDPEQCDKYWICNGGLSSRSLCPDGLVFHPSKEDGEDPCDHIHSVPDRCKGREKLQRPKPGDAHCPRQNGVYPSELPYECDVFYSCLKGVGSPTRCPEGLHYSEKEGICVWARDSGRTGCGVPDDVGERKKRKKKKEPSRDTKAPADKERPRSLSNGFSCPGGKLGVHLSLPHPTSCRSYYVCLNGVEPSERGCSMGKVFNPDTSSCDEPRHVPGCENFYEKKFNTRLKSVPEKHSKIKEEPRSGGGDLETSDIRGFLQILKQSGFLKDGALETLEKSLGNSDNINSQGLEDSFETPRESRRQTFLGRDRFKNLIPKLRTSGNVRDDTENEIESEVTSEGLGPDISEADSAMLEKMFEELLMSESKDKGTTEAAPLSPSVLSGTRPRRLRKPNLFNTDERRKSSILSRSRARVRLSTTTSTTPQSVEQDNDQENVVETAEKERPRIPFPPRGNLRSRFRPSRVRLPFRRPGRVREEENKADIEEMIKTLDMEDELKQEFNRFVADNLGSSSRPKFKPSLTGLRDRAKIRNNFLRTRFKNTNTTPSQQVETTTLEQIISEMTTITEETSTEVTTTQTTTTSTTAAPTTTTTQTTTTTTTTTTITTTTATTTVTTTSTTTTAPPTTTTTTTTTTSSTTVRASTVFLPTPPAPPKNPPALEPVYDDEAFEYVYYEYYYDYEYDDDVSSGVGASGFDEEISAQPQQHTPLELPHLKQQLLEQQHITRPSPSSQEQDNTFPHKSLTLLPEQPTTLINQNEQTRLPQGPINARQPPTILKQPPIGPSQPPPSPRQPPTNARQPPTAPRQPPTAPRQPPTAPRQPPTAPRQPPTAPRQPPTAPRQPPTAPRQAAPTESRQPPPNSRPQPSAPRQSPPRPVPRPPQPHPPVSLDDSRFPHFQNFKPIDPSLDPPVPILPPPPREQPRSQQLASPGASRQQEIQKQKEIEKQKQLERLALLEKQKQEMEFEEQRLREIERQQRLEKQKEIERQKLLEKQKELEKKANLERQREIENQREEERLRIEKEELERKKLNEEKRSKEEETIAEEVELERSTSREEQGRVEVTTFGPFSPFKNFPSFPVNVLENQQEQLELRGPNLLPTRPTEPPRGPPVPARPPAANTNEDQLRFIPSPPLREPVPPVNVFLSEEEEDSPSVFLPPAQPQQNFQNTFFNVQTQLGQTQTRIPPQVQTQSRPPPANQPFTFFGGQFQQRPSGGSGGPVSFPGQSFSPSPRPAPTPSTNQQFVNFNNFRSPEQPRTLQSVFGSSAGSLPPNTFFSRDARFDRRPSPSSGQASPGSTPVQRQSPPQTVFNLGPGSRDQRQSPSFPPPEFGGFRPIKRHLQVNQDEIFAEDLQLAQDRSRRHKNKKNKNGKKSGTAEPRHSKNKSEQQKKDLAKQKEKHQDRESSFNSARHKMQEALNNEVAKVYYEEFLQKNNAVDYYEDYFYDERDPDYYYYYYYDYE